MDDSDHFKQIEDVLNQWDRNAKRALDAHYETARARDKSNQWLGGLVSALGVFVAIAGAYQKIATFGDGILVILAGATVSAGSVWHTYLNPSDRSNKHKVSAARYAAVRRKISELKLLVQNQKDVDWQKQIAEIRENLDFLAEEAPSIPAKFWEKANKIYHEQTPALK